MIHRLNVKNGLPEKYFINFTYDPLKLYSLADSRNLMVLKSSVIACHVYLLVQYKYMYR